MLERRKNGAAPGPGATLTLGATREKLFANGYAPVSLLDPEGTLPPYLSSLSSEHPVAVRTLSAQPLAAIILTPPEEAALEERIRDVLKRRGLTRGPVRIGSDGRELYPVRPDDVLMRCQVLDETVALLCAESRGMGQGLSGVLIPLDGAWPQGTLLEISLAKLPALSSDEAQALFEELGHLPYKMAEEREPARPSRRAWLGVR